MKLAVLLALRKCVIRNGSLAYPSLAGALREAGFEVNIFDACVGNEKDDLAERFHSRMVICKRNSIRTLLIGAEPA
jgi:hypothetical protein